MVQLRGKHRTHRKIRDPVPQMEGRSFDRRPGRDASSVSTLVGGWDMERSRASRALEGARETGCASARARSHDYAHSNAPATHTADQAAPGEKLTKSPD